MHFWRQFLQRSKWKRALDGALMTSCRFLYPLICYKHARLLWFNDELTHLTASVVDDFLSMIFQTGKRSINGLSRLIVLSNILFHDYVFLSVHRHVRRRIVYCIRAFFHRISTMESPATLTRFGCINASGYRGWAGGDWRDGCVFSNYLDLLKPLLERILVSYKFLERYSKVKRGAPAY